MLDPRVGGGKEDTAWTGVPNRPANRRTRPNSTMARRPTDFKLANSIEQIATKLLAENQHIGPKQKTSKITLASWVNSIKTYIGEGGLDTVFWVYNASTDFYTYLLEYWGSAEPKSIQKWVDNLCTGVLNTHAAINAVGNEPMPM